MPDVILPDTAAITDEDLHTAAELIKEAKRPMIFVGGGAIAADASEELLEFAEKINAPVCDTLMGKGAFSGEHPLYAGMLGMHGTKYANFGVTHCDLLIAIGTRFSDRVFGNAAKFAQNAKVLQIDVDPAEIDKNIRTTASVIGDVKEVLKRLNPMIGQYDHKEWVEHIEELKLKFPLKYNLDGLTGPYVVEEIYRVTKGDAIITTEVGQHQMWAAQYYKYSKPRQLLTSGGLGTMGYGLPGAIGAKIGNPDKPVIAISGDGGMQMNIQEFATAMVYELPVIVVVFNNGYLGNVRQWQQLFFNKRYSSTCLTYRKSCNRDCMNKDKCCPKYIPDFVKLAESYEARGIRITKEEELKKAFDYALEFKKGPTLIECVIEREANVSPMVPTGKTLADMIMDC